jgi:hypothetical protein
MSVSQQQMNALFAQLQQLQGQVNSLSRDGAFAPSSNDPYVVPGPRDFYSYTQRVTFTAAGTAGATQSMVFQIEADSYFYMNAISYQADIALAAVTDSGNIIPLVTVVIFDSGSGRQLMANPTPLNCIAGYNGSPFRLPKPRRFASTAQITATLVNYSANLYNLSLTLSGFKVYVTQAVAVNGPVGT